MEIPDESARAPMRAHILASINPFQGAASGTGGAKGDSRRRRRRDDQREGRRKDRDGKTERPPEELNGAGGRHDSYEVHSEQGGDDDDDTLRPRGGKIRFKTRRREKHRQGDGDDGIDDHHHDSDHAQREDRARDPEDHLNSRDTAEDREHSRHHHRRHRSHHRRCGKRSQPRSPSPLDDCRRDKKHRTRSSRKEEGEVEEEDPYADPPLDPDAAFRQSLFDAMADDEGAAYWEAVYGQPVHKYAEEVKRQASKDGNAAANAGDPDGLSAMNDEEYADYVRRRMWERSQEGRREAREAQKRQHAAAAAAEKERLRAKQRAFEQDRLHWAAVERSLRRGQARRQRKRWQDQWQAYAAAWTSWEASPSPATIPWPVEKTKKDKQDKKDDGSKTDDKSEDEAYAEEVRAFFTGGPQDDNDGSGEPTTEMSLLARLRDERVRWHPDKMQQRLGGSVDVTVMRDITAIFQVVDRLWGELRRKR